MQFYKVRKIVVRSVISNFSNGRQYFQPLPNFVTPRSKISSIDSKKEKVMDVLPLHFRTLRYLGLWREPNERRLIKYFWRPFVININLFITISLLSNARRYRDSFNDLTESIFVSSIYVVLSLKLLNYVCRRDAMDELLNEFRSETCRPRNIIETNILSRYEKMIAMVFYLPMGVALSGGFALLCVPLLSIAEGQDDIDFPLKMYQRCSRERPFSCSIMYLLQILGVVIGVSINITLDTILAGFVLLTCAQVDLCCCRLKFSIGDNVEKSARECVAHQMLIRRILQRLESFFMRVAVPLVLIVSVMLCTLTYNISQTKFGDPKSFSSFTYLGSLLVQILCYCWFGSLIKLKSTAISETIYNSDWTTLKPLDRKSLFLIMLSCQREMGISLNGFCIISLEVFVWVVRTSYTAYNLLKTIGAS